MTLPVDGVRERVARLFEFLSAFNEKRNPVVTTLDHYAKVWWWSSIPDSSHVSAASFHDPADGVEDDENAGAILRVARPELERPPQPPAGLEIWLNPGWDDPNQEASWPTRRIEPDSGPLELSPEDEAKLLRWKHLRDQWAERSRQDFAALQLYQWLWDVNATIEREGAVFELALGDGILTWDTGNTPVRHPLVIQPLQIQYDPDKPAFIVTEAERGPELYAGLLRKTPADPPAIARLLDQFKTSGARPLGSTATETFLRRVAAELDPAGKYLGAEPPERIQPFPQVHRAPVLFLRRRALGFESAIQAIRDDLEAGGPIPDSLLALVGEHRPAASDTPLIQPFEQADEADDVLLTKEANKEQLEIARRLSRYSAVLVQGPPGTGKTHTIANLIGHFLAEGKTVLVTSQTTKALRVLREKVAEELQPLCVSVLEGDAESQKQLQQSVTTIQDRLSSTDPDQLTREADRLDAERKQLLSRIREARKRLFDSLHSEYSSIVVFGEEYSPKSAAEYVRSHEQTDGWIPGNIQRNVALPLSAKELRELYSINVELSDGLLEEVSQGIPDPADIPHPERFERLCTEYDECERAAGYRPELWEAKNRDAASVRSLADTVRHAFDGLDDVPPWYITALNAALADEHEVDPWRLLLKELRDLLSALKSARLARLKYVIALAPELDREAALRDVDLLLNKVSSGGRITWRHLLLHRSWKRLLEQITVGGKSPESPEHFQAIKEILLADRKQVDVQPRIALLIPEAQKLFAGDPASIEQDIERLVELLSDAIEGRPNRIAEANRSAQRLGFKLDRFLNRRSTNRADWLPSTGDVVESELEPVIEAECARLRLAELQETAFEVEKLVAAFPGSNRSNRPVRDLLSAIQDRQPEAYATAYERLRFLHDLRPRAARREELLARLAAVAPDWAQAIEARQAPHDQPEPPGEPGPAWKWKQLVQELDARKAQTPAQLTEEIQELRSQLRKVTADLIARRAWAELHKHTDQAARQALIGYVEYIRKIGKGTGKQVPRYREAARRRMIDARRAVPVWIAPLARVAEAFDPRTYRFDVVIIDEASQADALGLIAWYLGKSLIVVGDDQQVTPEAVGDRSEDMNSLIDTYLRDIPDRHLYDGQASVYQLAKVAFPGVVQLREHFRCLPEIISFSNALAYNDTIVPLRDPASARVGPAVIPYRVVTEPRDGDTTNVNETEALHIAALVTACIEQPEYKDLSIGVISLLGQDQAIEIEKLLLKHIPPKLHDHHRILCGIPPHFQGDERDVVFLSMVDRPQEPPPLRLRGDPGERFKKRYNVAASRAKDQLWIVHSLDRDRDLKTNDLRWRLLSWAYSSKTADVIKEDILSRAESPFEKDVLRRLINAGYRVIPQYSIGTYRIDIVVEGEGARLAIECDGAAYHSTREQIQADLDRQAQLERMGWQFHRIGGSDFYRNPDASFRRLVDRLEELGIRPLGQDHAVSDPGPGRWSELLERVRRRASELVSEWSRESVTRVHFPAHPAAVVQQRPLEPGPGAVSQVDGDGWKPESQPRGAPTILESMSPEPGPVSDNGGPAAAGVRENTRPGAISGERGQRRGGGTGLNPRSITSADEAAEYLRGRGFRVEDNRPKGGALWVYGPTSELAPTMMDFRRKGLRFAYSQKRGGWYLPVEG